MIVFYTVPEIWRVAHKVFLFHFGLFFALLHPIIPKNPNFKKMQEIPGDIIILHVYQKLCSDDVRCVTSGRTGGRIDGRMN